MRGKRFLTTVALLAGVLLMGTAAARGEVLTIRNAFLEVKYDAAAGRLSAVYCPSFIDGPSAVVAQTMAAAAYGPRTFIVDGKLSGEGGAAKVVIITDKTFGECQAIEIKYPNGNGDLVFLAPVVPFVLIRASLHNGGKEMMVANKVPTLSLGLDLGKPVEPLKAFGTGGLAAPEKNPGSYMWQAVVDPQSRSGVVGGWITTDRGSGIVFTNVADGRVRMDARVEYGRLRLAPGKTEALETFAVGYFDDARLGMEAWADAVAWVYAIRLPPQPVGYCTWYHAGASSEKALPVQSAFASKELAPFGFSVIQIDDGWQDGNSMKNGPRKNFTRVRPDGPYPSGMKATADDIKAKGLVPGIWFMPFAGTYNDPWFEKRQDWFVKTADGKPYDTSWGGTCLDMTHPAVQEYLRDEIKRIGGEWGYRYFKMDGMWTGTATPQQYVNEGYKDDHMGDAVHHNPDKTNIEAYRDGQKIIREAAGREVFILGCCAPQNMRSYGGAFGLVDAMRIGPDNGANWGGIQRGPVFGARNYHLHGRIWYNDPDPLYVRTSLPLAQARAICSWVAVSGQLNLCSDALPDLPAERLDILKRTMPPHGLQARPVDLFEENVPRIWVVADAAYQPRRAVVGLFNWSADKKGAVIERPVKDLGLSDQAEYVAFEFWSSGLVAPFKGTLKLALAPTSCAVLSVRAVAEHPQLISTSRQIMQGLVDVLEEKWAADARELAGTSKVVGGDAYELRVLTYSKKGLWKAAGAEVSQEDKAAGVTASVADEAGLVRVTLKSAKNRDVKWKVRFAAGQQAEAVPPAVTDLAAELPQPLAPVALKWKGSGPLFEVRRDDAVLAGGTGARSFSDGDASAGKTYQYSVVPISFSGERGPAATVKFEVPVADPGPVPPLPQVSLMTLTPESVKMGAGKFGAGQSAMGKPLTLGKDVYKDGIGLHAVGEAVYACKREWTRFVAVVGIDESQRSAAQSSIVCEVVAEVGKKKTTLAQSPRLEFGGIERWHFNVALPAKCARVRLVVSDAGDGDKSDHADWVNAGFRTE